MKSQKALRQLEDKFVLAIKSKLYRKLIEEQGLKVTFQTVPPRFKSELSPQNTDEPFTLGCL